QLSAYKESLSDTVYEQYITAIILSKTINLRWLAGDALKEYMNVSHINLTQKIINVIDEITEVAEKIENNFSSFEADSHGIVGSGTLEQVQTEIKSKRDRFSEIDGTADQLLYRASEFIPITNLGTSKVT